MAKRVLVLGFFSGRHSGMYRFVTEDLIDHLTAIGWQVTGASAYRNRPLRLIDMMLTSWRARPAYDVAVIDVFSGLAFRQAEANVWQLQRLKKPFVLTLHGGNLPEFSKKHPERVRRLLGAAAAVTAPSGYLRGALHHLRADIMLVPNPLDLSLYHYRQRGQFRPRLLYLRALHAVYNPMLAVRVVAHLRSSFPDIQLAMVGPDKGDGTLQAVQAEINRLGVGEQVKIIGGVPKSTVPSWHDQADIFINPTNVDNTPISLMEAMASGLCVVSTNVGGIPDLVADGQEALLVPPDDVEAMAAAVTRVLTEPGLGQRLTTAAAAHAAQLDWETVIQQWDQLLTSVTASSPN